MTVRSFPVVRCAVLAFAVACSAPTEPTRRVDSPTQTPMKQVDNPTQAPMKSVEVSSALPSVVDFTRSPERMLDRPVVTAR
jgi:hypothetical protein